MFRLLNREYIKAHQRIFNRWGVSGLIAPGIYWFRIFGGYGLHIKDTVRHRLIFSERFGHTKRIQVGPWSIRLLKPDALPARKDRHDPC